MKYNHNKYDFFLCSSLRSSECRDRNSLIISLIKSHNFTVYAPQIELPILSKVSDQEIFCKNFDAIQKSENMLIVFEEAGEGVFLEIGIAFALNKKIIALTNKHESGKMIAGLLKSITTKVNSLSDLNVILNTLKS